MSDTLYCTVFSCCCFFLLEFNIDELFRNPVTVGSVIDLNDLFQIEMGSSGELTLVDYPSGESVIEPHSCSELLVHSVTVQQYCSEAEACNVLGSNVGLSNVTDGCVESSREGYANSLDVIEMSRDALMGKCKNPDMSVVEKILEDDGGSCLRMCCGKVEAPSLESGGLYSGENLQDEANCDMPLEFITANDLHNPCVQQGDQKDDESNTYSFLKEMH